MSNASPKTQSIYAEPAAPGTSARYVGGRAYAQYIFLYTIAAVSIFAIWGAIGGVILPLHIQQIEVANYFTGADAGTDLVALNNLKAQIDAGTAVATADQSRLLGFLAQFEAARANSLSIVAAVSVFVTMLVQPIAGVLSDRTRSPWGRRAPWITAGAVIGAALLIGTRYSPTVGVMIVLYALASLMINVAQGPLVATVADRIQEQRIATVSAFTGFATLLGAVIGSVIAGTLFTVIGLDSYYPFALFMALMALSFVFFSRDRSSKNLQVEKLKTGPFLASFAIALRDHDFRWLWIAKVAILFGYTTSTAFSIYMLQSYVQPALSSDEAATVGPLLSLAALPGTVIALFVAGRWSDKVRKRKPFIIASSALFAVSMLIPMFWPSLTALLLQALVAGIALGAFLTVDQALFIELLPDKQAAGRDLGVSALGGNLGQAFAPVVAGQVVVLTGGYQAVWIVAFVVVVFAALAVIPIKRAA